MFVYLTLLFIYARVELFVLDSALEKAFATFTCKQTIVKTTYFIATHWAQVVEA